MGGLVPAIHAALPQGPVRHPLRRQQRLIGTKLSVACYAHVVIRCAEQVDGRDKPGHDAFKAAPGLSPYSELTAAKNYRY
jgi:hypothetical protein